MTQTTRALAPLPSASLSTELGTLAEAATNYLEVNVAGHSLRAGFATTAAAKGKSLDAIMRQTGHRSERVARGYIRHGSLFVDNAAAGLA